MDSDNLDIVQVRLDTSLCQPGHNHDQAGQFLAETRVEKFTWTGKMERTYLGDPR